jgi:hypothetical protein
MDIQALAIGIRIRCPGCGASQVLTYSSAEYTRSVFLHERDDCPILLQIEAALDELERRGFASEY